jgi:hypothetical protein
MYSVDVVRECMMTCSELEKPHKYNVPKIAAMGLGNTIFIGSPQNNMHALQDEVRELQQATVSVQNPCCPVNIHIV